MGGQPESVGAPGDTSPMGSVHDASQLAEFQQGETRLVFARYKGTPEQLFYLQDGKAGEFKQLARESLECFMPQCDDRRIVAVSRQRSGRRDGFSHLRGAGGHAPESRYHQQAKALIELWVKRRYPQLDVQLEQATAGRERVADVMVTSHEPHGRLAFEIQYSTLDPEEWEARHASYQAQGIRDVWLFGHHGAHLRVSPTAQTVKLSVLHRTVLRAGLPLLWINPVLGKIGTATQDASSRRCEPGGCTHSKPDEQWLVLPDINGERVHMEITDVHECQLVRGQFITPTMRGFAAAEVSWQAQRDADHVEVERSREERRLVAERRVQRYQRDKTDARARAAGTPRQPAPVITDEPRCQRCGLVLTDPLIIKIGVHADPHCDW